MPDNNTPRREAPISYRPPAALRDEFRARVEKSGLSVSAFITQAIFERKPPRQARRPVVEQKSLAHLLGEAAKIRDALTHLAQGEGAQRPDLYEQAVADLTEMRSALLKAMGRKP